MTILEVVDPWRVCTRLVFTNPVNADRIWRLLDAKGGYTIRVIDANTLPVRSATERARAARLIMQLHSE